MTKVEFSREKKIGIITIDAPPVNALNKEVINQLEHAIKQVDDQIAVVIVTGAGTKAFVAGADIKEFPSLTVDQGEKLCARGQSVFNQLSNLKQPVIAAIDGFALGGGLELALACDIRIATEKSTFGLPEVKLGIIPGYGGTQRLARLIGIGKAMQLTCSGEFISATEAHRLGLVEEVVDSNVMEKAMELAEAIASRGPIAVQHVKQAIMKGLEMSLQEGLQLEVSLFGEICTTEDMNEGVLAFFEKRDPLFTGK